MVVGWARVVMSLQGVCPGLTWQSAIGYRDQWPVDLAGLVAVANSPTL